MTIEKYGNAKLSPREELGKYFKKICMGSPFPMHTQSNFALILNAVKPFFLEKNEEKNKKSFDVSESYWSNFKKSIKNSENKPADGDVKRLACIKAAFGGDCESPKLVEELIFKDGKWEVKKGYCYTDGQWRQDYHQQGPISLECVRLALSEFEHYTKPENLEGEFILYARTPLLKGIRNENIECRILELHKEKNLAISKHTCERHDSDGEDMTRRSGTYRMSDENLLSIQLNTASYQMNGAAKHWELEFYVENGIINAPFHFGRMIIHKRNRGMIIGGVLLVSTRYRQFTKPETVQNLNSLLPELVVSDIEFLLNHDEKFKLAFNNNCLTTEKHD